MKKILVIIFMFLNILFANEIFDHQRDFSLRKGVIAIKGDLLLTGAPVLCVNNGYNQCDWNYDGYLYNASGLYLHDDDRIAKDSSGAYLNLPEGATIVWAGLYWQGHKWYKEYGLTKDDFNYFKRNIDKVVLKTPDGVYHDLTADQTDYYGFVDNDDSRNDGERIFYSCYKDVTDIVKKFKGKQYFVVGNIDVSDGYDQQIGDPSDNWQGTTYGPWGGWSLVVIYQKSDSVYKNIAIYDGFKKLIPHFSTNDKLNEECIEIPDLSGFLTPKYGNVNADMLFFAAGGEKKMNYDNLQLMNKDGNYISVSNDLNPKDDQFNDSITLLNKEINTTREYNPGIDIDYFDVGINGISNEIIGNAQTSTSMKLCAEASRTRGDQSFPSVIAFSTQLYTPKICYDNLTYYDENGNEITSGSQVSVGSKIRAEVEIKNLDNEVAKDLNVSINFDTNVTSYIQNSTKIKDVNVSNFVSIDDNQSAGSLGVIYNDATKLWKVGILGDDNNEFLPTSQNPNYVANIDFNFTVENEANINFAFTENYTFKYDNKIIKVDRLMPSCAELNATLNAYSLVTGAFNVVNMNYTDQSTIPLDDIGVNALHTQIVNKDFHLRTVKVEDDNVTVEKFNGIIKVALIKASDFDNLDSSQKLNLLNNEPELSVNYVSMGDAGSDPNYGEFNETYSKALREGTYKIVYLVHSDGSLVESKNNCLAGVPDYNCIWGMLTQIYTDSGYQNTANGNDVCPTGQIDTTACTCGEVCEYGQNGQGTDGANGDDHASEACLACVFGELPTKAALARDSFSIRPDHFSITNIPSVVKAGKEFNITIEALDYTNKNTTDYNETISTSVSPEINATDEKVSRGCKTGVIALINNVQFKNGETNLTLEYQKQVGDVNFTIKEVNGSEFAKCDEDDTNDTARLITPVTVHVKIIPDHFSLTGTVYHNFNSSNFTYISNDLNMSSFVQMKIQAKDAQNFTTTNYNEQCYAKNFDVNISHNIPSTLDPNELILFKDENGIEHNVTLSSDIDLVNLPKTYFSTDNNGSAEFKIYINFEKNYTKPLNEFNFTVNDVNISDEDNVTGNQTLDANATFRYGRIKVSNIAGYGNDINTTFEYQYWTDTKGWVVNKEHNNVKYGDFNHTLNSALTPYVTVSHVSGIEKGEENVTFHTIHNLPYSAKVHLAVNSWLWYYPLAKDYKAPSISNTDCRTHPCLKVNFLKSGSGWGGVQSVNNPEFNEANRTAEMNMSKPDVNVSKSQVEKINW